MHGDNKRLLNPNASDSDPLTGDAIALQHGRAPWFLCGPGSASTRSRRRLAPVAVVDAVRKEALIQKNGEDRCRC